MKKNTTLASVLAIVIIVVGLSACEQLQQMVQPAMPSQACTDGTRALNVGFYAYFSPVSYSADEDPASEGFNTHLGYEADLLTALEAMEGTGLSFVRHPIAVWPNIWLQSAEPEYDIVGGRHHDSRFSDPRCDRQHGYHLYVGAYHVSSVASGAGRRCRTLRRPCRSDE